VASAKNSSHHPPLDENISGETALLVDTIPLVEMLDDGFLLAGADGIIITANNAAVRFIGDNLVGRQIASVFADDDVHAAFTKTTSDHSDEELTFHVDGTVKREFRARFRWLKENLVAVLLFDMTLQRNLEKVRRDFVANVSHELRSPLTSLAGFIETMQAGDVDDDETRHRFLSIMDEEAKRMSRLIDDLLSLSRVEVMEHIVPDQQLDLLQLVAGVSQTLTEMAKMRSMKIIIDDQRHDSNHLPIILGNADEITGVFVNLLENAIKYGHPDTDITVKVTNPTPNTIEMDIINLGEGIESRHLPRLTERFYRVDKARSRQIGGTGLGLAIVKHVTNRHRGKLSVKSILGESTTVSVRLPTIQTPKAS
jgi:two-component system phosphate regulon sensor histidine kinase PhoR